MIYGKICECCGKSFLSKSNLKKYCSKACTREMRKRRHKEDGQLCWRCKKACGGCSWSNCLKPVKDWIADPIIIKGKDGGGDIQSYKIHKCPEFIRG